ncbi:MAG: hypothetical protein ACJAZO_002927 [Myxococcota bacterium]|jgi:hypothetical protein
MWFGCDSPGEDGVYVGSWQWNAKFPVRLGAVPRLDFIGLRENAESGFDACTRREHGVFVVAKDM